MDDQVWAAIEAAGPTEAFASFDPLTVDDVLQAERATTQYDRRRAFVASYAWAVPTRDAISRIAAVVDGRRVLEVCAGTGLWASLLSWEGVSVVATDGAPVDVAAHYPVERLEAEAAVLRYTDCKALLMCWPPFKDECAFRALQVFNGDRVVYIGDTRFTAERRFHDALVSSWTLVEQVPLPSWPGTLDCVYLYKRSGFLVP